MLPGEILCILTQRLFFNFYTTRMGKIIVSVIAVVAVVYVGTRLMKGDTPSDVAQDVKTEAKKEVKKAAEKAAENLTESKGTAKEFAMDSYYDDKGVWFSVKEIRVKKGDRVRIAVTNTKGMHDFVIDEFGVKQETPLNEKTVIEFVADKAGTFEYYCSKPGHRAKGQWGKLIVE